MLPSLKNIQLLFSVRWPFSVSMLEYVWNNSFHQNFPSWIFCKISSDSVFCMLERVSSGYSQSASLLAHNQITASQFIRRGLYPFLIQASPPTAYCSSQLKQGLPWFVKKVFLQDVRHNLREILHRWGRRSGLRQPNLSKRYRKVGRADCGNDFSSTL